ncbi:epidermal growth factor receptor substrate 15-like 1 [Phalaenopsis equestris]|uniref:epidermal growth factor receptor substrate 15-like 1 n=1 Tax=Phalaenopsis equestris TaxID=78828 RepID=UPI0009E39647|nr:epidermal growth factor receptor substrate 15-like 1 [Phalaenopsis equestris]
MAVSRPPNFDAFEAYFKKADLDQDGRISGSEAVAFFKGSNLPQPVLAQIWKFSDQSNNGFLSRAEFYNALKLVTVAQSGRELTPDIVKAALFSPAAAKIPAPQISSVYVPATVMSPPVNPRLPSGTTLPASPHIGVSFPTGSQNSGARGVSPGFAVNQLLIPPSNSHLTRPPQGTPAAVSNPILGVNQVPPGATSFSGQPQISNTSSISTNWFGMNSGVSAGFNSQVPVQGIVSSTKQDGIWSSVAETTSGLTSKPLAPSLVATSSSTSILGAKDPKALVLSGNGLSSDSAFGGDAFSATPQVKQDGLSAAFSSGSALSSSGISSAATLFQNSKVGALDSSQSNLVRPLVNNQPPGTQSTLQKNPLDPIQSTLTPGASKLATGIPNSATQPQLPWPRISQTDIQKYTKVFVEVDKDRDGIITGEQARNLFLSWKLPREVLKQVWDLADQDNDSMLSFREFCFALYLMERYLEGRSLPALIPDVLRFDEALLQATGRSSGSYGEPIWRPSPGLSGQVVPGSRPPVPATVMRPPVQSTVPYQVDGAIQRSQQRLMRPFPGNVVNQQNEEQAFEETTFAHKKSMEENKILDSREKVEYYRTKMQELVLYKSRCDNKLNEITERASGDKREVESLAKKYEEKYKQVAEVASKLTVEEATFRDIQGRKTELQNAIANMERGGSSDGLLQVRADRIQSDIEELVKALHQRCKHHGLDIKSKATIELPFGWQPGIQEGAIDWDEDWDKFEDEGFLVAKDLSVEVEKDVVPSKSLSPSVWSNKISTDGISPVAQIDHLYNTDEQLSSPDGRIAESESVFAPSECGSVRSPLGSPGRSAFDAPSHEFHGTHYDMHDISPRDKDNHSHEDAESAFSGDKFTDEPSWGTAFDTNYDVDSVWGFSPKDSGHERTNKNSFFGSEDFGTNHIRVDSPSASSVFGQDKKSPFFDSVPSTPHFTSNSSPRFSEGHDDRTFDDFSRFDSFSMHDSRFSPKRESHARFDSISSINDFDRSRGFSFDDSDPFGIGPFRSSENHSPKKNSDNWRSF